MRDKIHILDIGAGNVSMAITYELQKRVCQVILIARTATGGGASVGNMASIFDTRLPLLSLSKAEMTEHQSDFAATIEA